MKKWIIPIILGLIISFTSSNALMDYNADGWTASNGLNSLPGTASDVKEIPGGYSFRCNSGIMCYSIEGPWLYIGVLGSPQSENDDGEYVEVIAN